MNESEPTPEPLHPRLIRVVEDRLDWQENQEPAARASARWVLMVMISAGFVTVALVLLLLVFRHVR